MELMYIKGHEITGGKFGHSDLYLNIAHITAIKSENKDVTLLICQDGYSIAIRNPIEDILKQLGSSTNVQ